MLFAVWGLAMQFFLCWLQLGHKVTPQDLWEVADLASNSNLQNEHIIAKLTSP